MRGLARAPLDQQHGQERQRDEQDAVARSAVGLAVEIVGLEEPHPEGRALPRDPVEILARGLRQRAGEMGDGPGRLEPGLVDAGGIGQERPEEARVRPVARHRDHGAAPHRRGGKIGRAVEAQRQGEFARRARVARRRGDPGVSVGAGFQSHGAAIDAERGLAPKRAVVGDAQSQGGLIPQDPLALAQQAGGGIRGEVEPRARLAGVDRDIEDARDCGSGSWWQCRA